MILLWYWWNVDGILMEYWWNIGILMDIYIYMVFVNIDGLWIHRRTERGAPSPRLRAWWPPWSWLVGGPWRAISEGWADLGSEERDVQRLNVRCLGLASNPCMREIRIFTHPVYVFKYIYIYTDLFFICLFIYVFIYVHAYIPLHAISCFYIMMIHLYDLNFIWMRASTNRGHSKWHDLTLKSKILWWLIAVQDDSSTTCFVCDTSRSPRLFRCFIPMHRYVLQANLHGCWFMVVFWWVPHRKGLHVEEKHQYLKDLGMLRRSKLLCHPMASSSALCWHHNSWPQTCHTPVGTWPSESSNFWSGFSLHGFTLQMLLYVVLGPTLRTSACFRMVSENVVLSCSLRRKCLSWQADFGGQCSIEGRGT